MSRLNNPERIAFIRTNFVDNPLDKEGVRYWWKLFEDQKKRVENGKHAILDANWIGLIERNPSRLSVDELAHSIRHEYTMRLWDQEHQEPPAAPVDWQTGRW